MAAGLSRVSPSRKGRGARTLVHPPGTAATLLDVGHDALLVAEETRRDEEDLLPSQIWADTVPIALLPHRQIHVGRRGEQAAGSI